MRFLYLFDKPESSQDFYVKSGLLCATLTLVVLMTYKLWGTWDQLFGAIIGPLVILVAWFHWHRTYSVWSLAPAFFMSAYFAAEVFGYTYFLVPAYRDMRTYDISLLSVDGSFGFQPSISLRHIVDRVHLLWFFSCVYVSLPLAMGAAYVAHLRSGKHLRYIPGVY